MADNFEQVTPKAIATKQIAVSTLHKKFVTFADILKTPFLLKFRCG